MGKIVRVSVTFPSDLLKDFDEVTAKMGYKNRSKAVQDAVTAFISEYKWLQEEKGTQAGVLMLLYDHETKGLESTLTNIQHKYTNLIRSTMHIHLNKHNCLQTIAVKGKATNIKKLTQQLKTKRGVKLLKPITTTP